MFAISRRQTPSLMNTSLCHYPREIPMLQSLRVRLVLLLVLLFVSATAAGTQSPKTPFPKLWVGRRNPASQHRRDPNHLYSFRSAM